MTEKAGGVRDQRHARTPCRDLLWAPQAQVLGSWQPELWGHPLGSPGTVMRLQASLAGSGAGWGARSGGEQPTSRPTQGPLLRAAAARAPGHAGMWVVLEAWPSPPPGLEGSARCRGSPCCSLGVMARERPQGTRPGSLPAPGRRPRELVLRTRGTGGRSPPA